MMRRFTVEPPCCHRGDDDHLEKYLENLEKHRGNLLERHRGNSHRHLEKHPHGQRGRSRWGSRGGSPAQETKSTLDER